MNDEEKLRDLVDFIQTFPLMDEFLEVHLCDKGIDVLLEEYEKFIKQHKLLSTDLRIAIHIGKEKYAEVARQSPRALYFIDATRKVNDFELLKSYANDLNKCNLGEFTFKDADKQHYNTLKESIAHQQVDYSSIVGKYLDCYHPYVNMQIATGYINGKNYEIGLPFLHKVLIHIFNYPNIYWDNVEAFCACAEGIHMFQYLLGPQGLDQIEYLFPHARYEILKLVFLYISRVIYMGDSALSRDASCIDSIPVEIINMINFYSIRADFLSDYINEFSLIFGGGVNVNVQVLADKAMANEIAMKFGLEQVTQQCYWDALKIYRYGSLASNPYGSGIIDIEDDTFSDLVQRANRRSASLAMDIYKSYLDAHFVLSKSALAECMWFLKDKLVYDISIAIKNKKERISSQKAWIDLYTSSLNAVVASKVESTRRSLMILKPYADYIRQRFEQNQIRCLYHFTSIENIPGIIKNGGLFSWMFTDSNNVNVIKQGGGVESRKKDAQFGLEDYVRLSFCDDHPMQWRKKCEGCKLVLLKIKTDVALAEDTLFSDVNAADSSHHHGGDIESFNMVDFKAVKQHYVSRGSQYFKKHQAEVMVKTCVPIEYIVNIDDPILL